MKVEIIIDGRLPIYLNSNVEIDDKKVMINQVKVSEGETEIVGVLIDKKENPETVEWKNGVNRTVYGVGYLDEGPYLAFINGEPTKAYCTWANMLKRCYCESSLKARPTYKGCSVCDEWHSFQNFADWFYENYIEGYHLDKDVLIDGNKEYSPETCSFISHADNNIKARAKHYTLYHDDFGLVDIYNLNAFCKHHGLNSGHMCSVNSGGRLSHKGWKKPESPEVKDKREAVQKAMGFLAEDDHGGEAYYYKAWFEALYDEGMLTNYRKGE